MSTFQINRLAPFLLTSPLMDKLVASKASLIQTSSPGARPFGKLVIDDLDHDKGFTAQLAYGTVKLENILFTTDLRRRFHLQGVSTAAFRPSAVRTSFATGSDSFMKRIYNSGIGRAVMVTPARRTKQGSRRRAGENREITRRSGDDSDRKLQIGTVTVIPDRRRLGGAARTHPWRRGLRLRAVRDQRITTV
ncbi:MAG TPA: hypothetical protein VGC45_06210 [Gryllotalpicola sp.]